jgi:ribosomal silencing factor RsfS
MNKYNLVSTNDANQFEELQATTFEQATEEALGNLRWYVIDDADYFVAVNSSDSNDTFDLSESTYEDAQYEAIERLGYFISSPL